MEAADGLNRLTQSSSGSTSLTFGYDGRGNLTGYGPAVYGYTAENRLATASNGATFLYDPVGRLSQSSGMGAVTRFQYDGDALVAERNSSGQIVRRYVHGPEVDQPLVWYEGSGTTHRRWLHQDERGSVVAISDESGQRVAINAYDEFGTPAGGNVGRFQYTGQTWLPELGLYYYKARMYAPALGRFMQTDPIGYEDGLNLYSYVGNDPVNAVDPTGMVECADSGCETSRISPEVDKGPPPVDSDLKGAPDRPIASVTFRNDDPKGASPNQPIATQTAVMVESAIAESGVSSVNINSTTGGKHSSTSLHHTDPGTAVDINRVNGRRVDDASNREAVGALQDAVANRAGIRENFGPTRNERTTSKGKTHAPSDKVVKQHRNHVHIGGPWK